MIHARARCWIHEDCLADLELSIACGPNTPNMQVLDGDWDGGDCYGDGCNGDDEGDGDGNGCGGYGYGDGDDWIYGYGCGRGRGGGDGEGLGGGTVLGGQQ